LRALLYLAADDVQFSIARVLALLELDCGLLVLELLYLCPQGLGAQDGIAAVVDEGCDLLELLAEFAEGEDAVLLSGHVAEVRVA
jgi:hypothetical protein